MALLDSRPARHRSQRDELPPMSDRAIKRFLVADLQEDRRTRAERLRVDVKQGVVVVGGTVASVGVRRLVDQAAWRLPGVRGVSNQVRVAGAPVAGSQAGGR